MRNDLKENILNEVLRQLPDIVTRAMNNTSLNEAFDWREHYRSIQMHTDDFVNIGYENIDWLMTHEDISKQKYPMIKRQERKIKSFGTWMIIMYIEDSQHFADGKFDMYAYRLWYENNHSEQNKGWAADIVRFGNSRLNTIYRIHPHYINRFLERQYKMQPIPQSDKSRADLLVAKIISDLHGAYIMSADEKQLERHSAELAGFGWWGTGVVVYTKCGAGLGFSNSLKSYIMLNTYISDKDMYNNQRKQKSQYYTGRFFKNRL